MSDATLDGDACLNVDAVRRFAVQEFEDAAPLVILGAFMLPVEGRTLPVPVLGSESWQ